MEFVLVVLVVAFLTGLTVPLELPLLIGMLASGACLFATAILLTVPGAGALAPSWTANILIPAGVAAPALAIGIAIRAVALALTSNE